MKILAIDLGKFKSVACLFDTETNQSQYETIPTVMFVIEQLLQTMHPDKVVIETCTISGWVCDLCQGHGFEVVVANPSELRLRLKQLDWIFQRGLVVMPSRTDAVLANKPRSFLHQLLRQCESYPSVLIQ
jgi:hypothetical protein